MPKSTEKETNLAHIEGLVYSCEITELPNNQIAARMQVCTASVGKNEDESLTYSNWLHHHVIATATGDKAEKLKEIQQLYQKNKENFGKEDYTPVPIPISITGTLACNNRNEPFIRVAEENIEFPKKVRMKNTMSLKGEVVGTAYNDAYASAVVKNVSDDGKEIKIPICIYSKDNPRKWADLSSGKTKVGDILSVTGPLISRNYGNGDKKIFRCTVNVANYTVMNKKKEKKETTTLGF